MDRRTAIGSILASLVGTVAQAELIVTDHGLTVPADSGLIVVDYGAMVPQFVAAKPDRLIVYYWSTSPCPPCARFHREKSKLTWIEFRDGRKETRGSEPPSYPFYRVDVPGDPTRWYPISGWLGPEWFEGELGKRGIRPAKARKVSHAQSSHGYPTSFTGQEWGVWPSTKPRMIQHLDNEAIHNFDRDWLHSLTWPQLVALHSDSHNRCVRWQFVRG